MKLTSLMLLSSLSFGAHAAVSHVGMFSTPVGESAPGPAFPGKSYEFMVYAHPGQKLNFTSMYGASNDWFFSSMSGILLKAGTWDVTDKIEIYDAGSEVDQNSADAPDTAGNQSAPNTGLADPVNAVRCLSGFPGFASRNFIKVTTSYLGKNEYRIRIHVKDESKTPLSPGVFWISQTNFIPFKINAPRLQNGLEAQAEDGNPAELYEALTGNL